MDDFPDVLRKSKGGDIHIIPLEGSDIESLASIANIENKTYLFVHDSTKESVLV